MTDTTAPPSASRKHRSANLARGIDELDALGSLAIAKRSSQPPRAPQNERPSSPSAATLAGGGLTDSSDVSGQSFGAGGSGANGSLTQSSQASRPSRSGPRPRPSVHPADQPSIWPQWLFAAAVLGAALWYLFSVEPRSVNRSLEVDRRALTPKR